MIKKAFVSLYFIVFFSCNSWGEWPNTVSNLNSWRGLTLEKGSRCEVCYSISIPSSFGLTDDGEKILVLLPSKALEMIHDINGPLFADRDVLDYFYQYSITHQKSKFTKYLISPEKYGFEIGVETSESLYEDYTLPLLENYKELNEIVELSDLPDLSKKLCEWATVNYHSSLINNLLVRLEKDGYLSFQTALTTACDSENNR